MNRKWIAAFLAALSIACVAVPSVLAQQAGSSSVRSSELPAPGEGEPRDDFSAASPEPSQPVESPPVTDAEPADERETDTSEPVRQTGQEPSESEQGIGTAVSPREEGGRVAAFWVVLPENS